MLTLLLLRHAKSSWGDADQSDFDRPLAKRGMGAAPEMGAWIAGHNLVPELVLCSAAMRTRETLKLLLPKLNAAPCIEIDDDLYLAGPSEILDRLHSVGGAANPVMVIGHNPGLHALAAALAARGDKAKRSDLTIKFPTAALAVISFDASSWADIRPGAGELLHFVTPKGLG